MTSRRTAISCRRCGAPGRWYLGGRLCPRHAPGGPDGEVMRAFPDYTGRIPQVKSDKLDSPTNRAAPAGNRGLTAKTVGSLDGCL